MKRTAAVLGVVAAATLVLAGCTSPLVEEEAKPVVSDTALTTVLTPTWTIDVKPLGTNAVPVVDDTVLVYVKTPDADISLAAYDAANGELRWTRPASINNRVGGLLYPMVIGEDTRPLVASIGVPQEQPNGTWAPEFALLDPKTGSVEAMIAGDWVSSLWDCGLSNGVCFWGNTPGVSDGARYQLTLDQGVRPYKSGLGNYPRTRSLGAGVWGVADESGAQSLVRVVDGEETWKVPAVDVVGGDGDVIDSLGGWYPLEEDGMLQFNATGVTAPETFVSSASEGRAGAIDLATGTLLWSNEGQTTCFSDSVNPVFCSGDFSFRRDVTDGPLSIETGTVTVTGVDPRTGESAWDAQIENLSGLTNLSQGGALRSFGHYLPVRAENDIVLIDRKTGKQSRLKGTEAIGCTVPTKATFSRDSIPAGLKMVTEVTGAALEACTANGSSTDVSTFTQALVDGSGSRVLVDGAWKHGSAAPVSVVSAENAILGYVR
ncbi:PQQ-binding-like beta-propeller repeat protein [Mycetocola tolaasinivorans]|nr:PQQ-binding-like beta-propeller repeat protein [Mycetocola tolaasinivorans]